MRIVQFGDAPAANPSTAWALRGAGGLLIFGAGRQMMKSHKKTTFKDDLWAIFGLGFGALLLLGADTIANSMNGTPQ